jgi:hypothetical protein
MINTRIKRPIYRLFLNCQLISTEADAVVEFDGIKMISIDGREILINNRVYDIYVESYGAMKFRIQLDIVNEGEAIEERIDYMLDEEYEIHPLICIRNRKTGKVGTWKIDWRESCQTEEMMEMDMNEGVRECLEFLMPVFESTNSTLFTSGEIVRALNDEMPDAVSFIRQLKTIL